MNALTLSATRRRKPIVILNALAIERLSTKSLRSAKNSSTTIRVRLARALSAAWRWTRSNCTPRRIFSAVFSAKLSTVVAVIIIAAMWWHNITISNTIEAQEAVGFDCLLGMPWGIVWAIRFSRMPMPEEGGVK